MFNVNFMLAQAIQNDHLRVAQRERLTRQWLKVSKHPATARICTRALRSVSA